MNCNSAKDIHKSIKVAVLGMPNDMLMEGVVAQRPSTRTKLQESWSKFVHAADDLAFHWS